MKKTQLQIQGGILGAACFAALIRLISESPPIKPPLLLAVFALAVAIPTNVLLYLVPDLSKFRLPGRRQPRLVALYYYLQAIANLCAFLSIAALFWHLCLGAALLFLCISLASVLGLLSIRKTVKRKHDDDPPSI
jgi:fatty acid desaturase